MFFNKDDEAKKKTYTVDVYCENCEDEHEIDVPFGMRIDEYLATMLCNTCGCAALKFDSERKK